MNSMTGYGRGEATNGEITVVIEMKSVNNRFCDVQLRMPREYLVFEQRVNRIIRDRIHRGRVDVFVRRSSTDSGRQVHADVALAERYHRAMLAVARRLQRDDAQLPLEVILSQPGVLSLVEAETDALAEWDVAEPALDAALAEMLEMRAAEGAELKRELRRHLDDLQRLRAEVEASAEGVAQRLRRRLDTRIQRLLADRVDPVRLAQEAVILADKADISEELLRIHAHCKQFSEALERTEPVGRKLDFLLQELNREINTIGSKAAEHPIAARVVEMKSVLERMREQAANVE